MGWPFRCAGLPRSDAVASTATILLVDDEESVQKLLTYPLEREGFRVIQARNGEEALERFEADQVDLIVLDLMLPRVDGLEVCRRVRSTSTVPIIMLTARDDEVDKVLGLELRRGRLHHETVLDPRVPQPGARALRRAQLAPPDPRAETIESDGLVIDLARRSVEAHSEPAQLTYVEFELLRTLALIPVGSTPGRRFSRRSGAAPTSRPADDRRPHPASAREDRTRPSRARVHLHRAWGRIPLSGQIERTMDNRRSRG